MLLGMHACASFGLIPRSSSFVFPGLLMSNAAQDRPSGDRQQRRAFVVVGMHRSGTSAMTRTLTLLGASLPQGIMSAHEDNPTGFWEPQSVADLNDEILQALDSEWDDVFSFRPRNYL